MEVKQTTDYALFKDVSSNRDVDQRHVRNLAAAIQRKDLLHVNPILVNKRMEVLDGQHRLAAARLLQKAVFYIVDEAIDHSDIARLNTNKKNWQLMDYINYYTVKGVKQYKELARLINEFPNFPPSFIIAAIGDDGSRQRIAVMNGLLDTSNIAGAKEVFSCIKDFEAHFTHTYNSRFLEALLFLYNTGSYNHEVMVNKLQRYPGCLVACANKKQYIKLLQEVYNKGTHEKNIVLFLKR